MSLAATTVPTARRVPPAELLPIYPTVLTAAPRDYVYHVVGRNMVALWRVDSVADVTFTTGSGDGDPVGAIKAKHGPDFGTTAALNDLTYRAAEGPSSDPCIHYNDLNGSMHEGGAVAKAVGDRPFWLLLVARDTVSGSAGFRWISIVDESQPNDSGLFVYTNPASDLQVILSQYLGNDSIMLNPSGTFSDWSLVVVGSDHGVGGSHVFHARYAGLEAESTGTGDVMDFASDTHRLYLGRSASGTSKETLRVKEIIAVAGSRKPTDLQKAQLAPYLQKQYGLSLA